MYEPGEQMGSDVDLEQVRIGTRELGDEMMLLGGAMLAAQKLEFALYGMASFIQKKKGKFKELTPEEFLRGDGTKTRETLGTIVSEFSSQFSLDGEELTKLVSDRNLIAHNYWRMTKANISGGRRLENPEDFLFHFTVRCEKWIRLCQGWIAIAMGAVAEREERLNEIETTLQSKLNVQAYLQHLTERASTDQS